MSVLAPADTYDLKLETEHLHADPAQAVLVAREWLSEPAALAGIECVSVGILSADLSFQSEPHGEIRIRVGLRDAIPFPYAAAAARASDALSFEKALIAASQVLHMTPVYVDHIEENESWWLFKTFQIGCHGAVVRKRDGKTEALGTGSAKSLEAALWAFDRGLLEPDVAIVVTRVRDSHLAVQTIANYLQRPTELVAALLEALPAHIPLQYMDVGLLWPAREALDFEVVRTPVDAFVGP